MKGKILFFLILSILLSCRKDKFPISEIDNSNRRTNNSLPSLYDLTGNWIVVSYENLEDGSIITKSDENSRGLDVEIKFSDDTFCGFNTTNDIAGHFSHQDSTIKIDVYGGSKVGQPKWGNMFSDVVYSIESVRRSNSQIRLFYNSHKNCIVLNSLRKDIVCHWTYSKN
jgi:hypothetical protein